jgi:hypothetical protein
MHGGKTSPDGAVTKKSKTADVFDPQAGYTPTPNNTLPLQIDDAFGIVTFTQQSWYRGAMSSSTLSPLGRRRDRAECQIRSGRIRLSAEMGLHPKLRLPLT